MTKIDSETKQMGGEYLDYTKLSSWEHCCTMLERRCQQLDDQCKKPVKHQVPNVPSNNSKHRLQSNQHSLLVKDAGKNFCCNHCGKPGHTITAFQRFIVLLLAQSMDQVIQQKLPNMGPSTPFPNLKHVKSSWPLQSY